MKYFMRNILFACIVFTACQASVGFALQDGCAVSDLSLNIVFVFDSSTGITRAAFSAVRAATIGFVNEVNFDLHPNSDVRISFVNLGEKAHRANNLTLFKTNDEATRLIAQMEHLGDAKLNIESGLKEAMDILSQGTINEASRNFVVLFSGATVDCTSRRWKRDVSDVTVLDPCRAAEEMESEGISLVTVALNSKGSLRMPLIHLSSNPTFSIAADTNMIEFINRIFCSEQSVDDPQIDLIGITAIQKPRECPCTLPQLWLDIVVIFDSSAAAGSNVFASQRAAMIGFLHQISVSQEKGMHSRVAFISLGKQAHRTSNLTSYNSNEEAISGLMNMEYLGNSDFDLESGLKEAANIFAESDERQNAKNLVIMFSSSAVQCGSTRSVLPSACATAAAMENSGIAVVSIPLSSGGNVRPPLVQLGNPCLAVPSDTTMMDTITRIACKVNCFCPHFLDQFRDSESCEHFGECISAESGRASAVQARFRCAAKQMTVATVSSHQKHNFISTIAAHAKREPFWIALSGNNAAGKWQSAQKYIRKRSSKWDVGQPNLDDGSCVVAFRNEELKVKWKNVPCDSSLHSHHYFCQKETCDTDHYCE